MATTIHPVRLNHMNLVLQDVEKSQKHFLEKYDAEFVADVPKSEYHACLFETGGVLFELFFPKVYLLNARYGPHYVGVEYQADMDTVCAAIAERNMRIVRESRYEKDLAGNPGYALHTHPADGFGVSYEFYHDDFHQWNWPMLGGRFKSSDYWLNHTFGLSGQQGYTHAVEDIDAASQFLQGFLGAQPVYEIDRPQIGARAIGLSIADVVVELQTPVNEGVLAQHLYRYGDGIRSTVFRVENIDRAKSFLESRGLPVEQGYAPEVLQVPAEANLGVIFEFTEA